MSQWIYGKTLSRHGVSNNQDITPQLIEEVNRVGFYKNFSVKRGTINIELKEDLIFDWEFEIPSIHWRATMAFCGAKLRECILGCKNEDGQWEDSRAFLYDPDNPGDSYLNNPRKHEVFAEKEFNVIRNRRMGEEVEVRTKLERMK